MVSKVVQASAVLPTALALVSSGAHLFEPPNKTGLPRDAHFAAQGLYWEALRRRWEHPHAVNAFPAFLALCPVVLSVLPRNGRGSDGA